MKITSTEVALGKLRRTRGRSLLRGAAFESAEAERESQRAYSRARADARRAEQFYKRAATNLAYVSWVTGRPGLWDVVGTPAAFEEAATTWTHLADHFLQSSFRQTQWARERAARARYYREMETAS